MDKQPKGSERKPSLSTYIVEKPIETALSDMEGVHVFGDMWIVKAPRTNSRKLRNKLRECIAPGDFLLVSRIQPMWTHGKGIGGALDLLEELD